MSNLTVPERPELKEKKSIDSPSFDGSIEHREQASIPSEDGAVKVKWYRSSMYNALVLGLCNFLAPGLWGAMNSLGAGGLQDPKLAKCGITFVFCTANAIIFCLMVVTALCFSALVHRVGIVWCVFIGAAGYAPYASGLYTNLRYSNPWWPLVGAAICGCSAGIFWASEAAIAIAYPEQAKKGQFLGIWLTFKVMGQVVGGAINLGINAKANEAGAVSYAVYIIFITLQALGPFSALLLTPPAKVQRTDGRRVVLKVLDSTKKEIAWMLRILCTKKFLLVCPLIAQAVYSEAVIFTYSSLWFSVRGRSLGSFVSGLAAALAGNLFGRVLDSKRLSLKQRGRAGFFISASLRGAFMAWNVGVSFWLCSFRPTYDWVDSGFGMPFALFVLQIANFQVNYMFLFWMIGQIAESSEEMVRMAGLLRAVESASQAVSYGLASIETFALSYGAVLNLAMWAVALLPAWMTIRRIGVDINAEEREQRESAEADALYAANVKPSA